MIGGCVVIQGKQKSAAPVTEHGGDRYVPRSVTGTYPAADIDYLPT
jgi:hypothetical protein